jgi:hypothetical protein
MSTVNEVLAKDTWDEKDISILLANVSRLPIDALVKLGLAPAQKAVKEPVAVEAPVEPVITETVITEPVKTETPKKRSRKSTK